MHIYEIGSIVPLFTYLALRLQGQVGITNDVNCVYVNVRTYEWVSGFLDGKVI